METFITIKVSENELNDIKEYYSPYVTNITGEYISFVADKDGTIITGYLSNKQNKKVTFKGENAEIEAKIWNKPFETPKENKTTTKGWVDLDDQIGSDEVGVGDFLLPMIVVATYIRKQDIKLLKDLGVDDSKKLTDAKIKEIAQVLINKIEYSKLTLPNDKYNEEIAKGENLNSLKAKMHNRALSNLVNKHPDVVGVYVDQFVAKETYYKYLNDKNEKIIKDISFKTKGESVYPCVAAASIIARYAFLLEVDKLNKKYKINIPFGASSKVDGFSKEFINKFGIEEFNKIAKKNFANYKKVTDIKLI